MFYFYLDHSLMENSCLHQTDRTRVIRRLLYVTWQHHVCCKIAFRNNTLVAKKMKTKKITNIFATLFVLQFGFRNNTHVAKHSDEKKSATSTMSKKICNITFVAKYFCNTALVAIMRTKLDAG